MFHTIFSDILRFRISVFLLKNTADFVTLREKFEVTDGNLSFHLKKLESENIIEISKNFV